jgi:tRNA(Ile)-lysidine synthase TilS/MesJ
MCSANQSTYGRVFCRHLVAASLSKGEELNNRPYRRYSIGEIEYIAQENWGDAGLLKKIKYELNFRDTPRSEVLKKKIKQWFEEKMEPIVKADQFCDCGNFMHIQHTRRGLFWFCNDPDCGVIRKVTMRGGSN